MNLSEQLLESFDSICEQDSEMMKARDEATKAMNAFTSDLSGMQVKFSDLLLDVGESGLPNSSTEYVIAAIGPNSKKKVEAAAKITAKRGRTGIKDVLVQSPNPKVMKRHLAARAGGFLNDGVYKGDEGRKILMRVVFVHSDVFDDK